MEPLNWLIPLLRSAKDVFPVEIALTLGVLFFALSWIMPRRLLTLPGGARGRALTLIGLWGSLAVLAVATTTSWIGQLQGYLGSVGFDGWLRRPAPLLAAAAVLGISAIALSRSPLPAPGERAIQPRRRWWDFAPRLPLGIAGVASAALLLTTTWHTLIGVSAPPEVEKWDQADGLNLPIYFEAFGGIGYLPGAGWPNHLATIVALALGALALVLALGSDANSPAARASATDIRAERSATARVYVLILCGGLLLTLGAVWAHVGFVGEGIIGLEVADERVSGSDPVYVGTSYQAFAGLMHRGGYVVQGIGAALMLRLAVDTVRAAVSRRRADAAEPARGTAPEPDPGTAVGAAQASVSGTADAR